jgi:4-amino-4-deoxy-L-arabinose transferase-like glycosyltransferase
LGSASASGSASGRACYLLIVLALFGLPLFVNLGASDLENDEAIYAFAVDRIVEAGDWLVPKTIPYRDVAFLEKPPLKFWLVAGPIEAGVAPHDEFGFRVWDAVFGAAAFGYVFLIGCWLMNPVCGFVAVLMLFAHAPLLFTHGLRSHNMEAPLVLAYCGGVYHYLRWVTASVRPKPDTTGTLVSAFRRTWHLFAIAIYFVLAFMTKFVAALFLPLILGAAILLVPDARVRLRRDWRWWAAAALLAAALIAPWFVFAWRRFGPLLWQSMFGVHVYQRFTNYLDPGHLRPWNHYFSVMFDFWETATLLLMFAGVTVIGAWTARRRRAHAIVVVLWFVLPMAAISVVTSKLYHYAYPFLPALALAGGYAAAMLMALGPAPFSRLLDRVYRRAAVRVPRTAAVLATPVVRGLLGMAIASAVALAIGSLLFGEVRGVFGGTELKSAGVLRPGLAALSFAVLLGIPPRRRRLVFLLFVISLLPLQGYRDTLELLGERRDTRRQASACVHAVQAASPSLPRGVEVDVPAGKLFWSTLYYFDRIGPLTPAAPTDSHLRPRIIWAPGAAADSGAAAVDLDENLHLLLPGPYAGCAG